MVLPWYKESRLVLIASAGAAAAGFFAVLAWRRHRQLVLSYAQVEKQVAQRTRELELADQELLQSQKMRALGTLAAGIAHDFNNILSIVKGSTQIIEDNLDNPGKIRTRADRIKTVVDQGSTVVQALLGFSRGSDEMLEACEINSVVDNTLKLLGDRFLARSGIALRRRPCSASRSRLPKSRAADSAQLHLQRGRVDGRTQARHHHHFARRPVAGANGPPTGRGGRLCQRGGAGFRLRYCARTSAARLRAVLHHQSLVHPARNRAGPVHCL